MTDVGNVRRTPAILRGMRLTPLLTYGVASVLLIVAIFVVPGFFYSRNLEGIEEVAEEQVADRAGITEQMHKLSHESQRNLTNDYSFWDDMIELADRARDDEWGMENLTSGIDSFGVDGVWVVDRAGAVRFGLVQGPGGEILYDTNLPVGLDIIRATTASSSVGAFHRFIGPDIVTIMTAGLVPTADAARLTPPQGYFVTLSRNDATDLQALSGQTDARLSLRTVSDGVPSLGLLDIRTGRYAFELPLTDWDGSLIAHLHGERESKSVALLFKRAQFERMVSGLLLGLLALLMLAFVGVNARARRRAELIAETMTRDLRTLNAQLETRVQERTRELEDDIRQRKAAEEQLLKRTSELERINKIMLDRELRIVELKKKAGGTS